MKEKQQIEAIRQTLIGKIMEAVEKQNGCIATYNRDCGGEQEEYVYEIGICIHNSAYPEAYAGYIGAALRELHISDDGRLACTLGDDSHYDDWDEAVENVQTEGLLKIVEWLTRNGFIEKADPWRCAECGSPDVQQQGWVRSNTGEVVSFNDCDSGDYLCDYCGDHRHIICESELTENIERWFAGELRADDDEVISGLDRNAFASDETFSAACREKWDALGIEEKIRIWHESTRDKSNDS